MRLQEMNYHLLKVGWTYDSPCTPDEEVALERLCKEIAKLSNSNTLDENKKEEYALKVYDILSFGLVSVPERADRVSSTYLNSTRFKKIIGLIDEAQLCFYRKYYTASLALLFIILEKYLRDLYGWTPGASDPTFAHLRSATSNLPKTYMAYRANKILDVIYSRYDSLNPTIFYFNRHGLLHGLEREETYDEMNCARIFNLLNILCLAEGVHRTAGGENLKLFGYRYNVYENCFSNKLEEMLISVDYTK